MSPQGEKKRSDHVIVVVNGAATAVAIQGNPSLEEVVETALQQTQNSGQPAEAWELRGPDDAPIADLSTKIKKLDLDEDDRLYVNLRAGIGG